jgi:predicted neutral ceramidase superfamily lipid hydrolase
LIEYIKRATLAAVSDLERAKAGARSITVRNVKVIGEEKLETLCLLTDKVLQRAKMSVIPIFASAGLFLMLFLMFV